MTGRPSSPVLSEILDLPGTCPNEGEGRQEETEGRGKWSETQEEKSKEYGN